MCAMVCKETGLGTNKNACDMQLSYLCIQNVAHDNSYDNVKWRLFMKWFCVQEAASIEVFSLL